MKKIFFIAAVILLCQHASGQQNATLTKQDYLQKRKTQKLTGWILLGSGVAMAVSGAIINLSAPWDGKHQNDGVWMVYAGGPIALASIPFFISAHHNKKKAAALAFNMNPGYYPGANTVASSRNISVKLTLHL
ncbi:MAG: hypothetical protein JST86_20735 [Bacteroidetes bacterium]|nr:hypothetical protein [Bacteroidota bacterium]